MYEDIKLPKEIIVKIRENKKNGVFLAELPKYDIFTEANTFNDLVFMVNDLIYTYFDVPAKLRNKFWYTPPTEKDMEDNISMDPLLFKVLTAPDSNFNLHA